MANPMIFNELQAQTQAQAQELDAQIQRQSGIPSTASTLSFSGAALMRNKAVGKEAPSGEADAPIDAEAVAPIQQEQPPIGAVGEGVEAGQQRVEQIVQASTRMRQRAMADLQATSDGGGKDATGLTAAQLEQSNSTVGPAEQYANGTNTQLPLPDVPVLAGNDTGSAPDGPVVARPFNYQSPYAVMAPAPYGVMAPPPMPLMGAVPAPMPMFPFHPAAAMAPVAAMPAGGAAPGLDLLGAKRPRALPGLAGPWIGILGSPTSPQCDEAAATINAQEGGVFSAPTLPTSCFNSYYAEWLTAAGARVFGIPYDASDTLLDVVVASASGIVWPGGDIIVEPNTTLYQTARRLLDRVIVENQAGRLLPLLTICQGHEILASLVHGSPDILTIDSFVSDGVALGMSFTTESAHSQFLQTLGQQATSLLQRLPLATHLNADGLTPDAFASSRNLAVLFRVLATTVDLQGQSMVSLMEARTMPIISFQWHPERSQFDWRQQVGSPHTPEAITAMAAIADTFVNIARLAPRAVATEAAARVVRQASFFAMRRVPVGDASSGAASLLFDPPTPADSDSRTTLGGHAWRLGAGNLTRHRKDVRPTLEDGEPKGEGVNATTGEPLAAINRTASDAAMSEDAEIQEAAVAEGAEEEQQGELVPVEEEEQQELAAEEGVAFREVRGETGPARVRPAAAGGAKQVQFAPL